MVMNGLVTGLAGVVLDSLEKILVARIAALADGLLVRRIQRTAGP
jgi:hypothetical protein